jgi:dethiobiotin synthetase
MDIQRKPRWFITGTDTEIGKTWSSLVLLHSLQQRSLNMAAMKPIASDCQEQAGGLRNADALLLQAHASAECAYEHINPYAFKPPVSPHLAAAEAGVEIDLKTIQQHFKHLETAADGVLIEGVGGWRVPLSATLSVVDLAKALHAPVILVVGLRLGCINHALLSAEAIQRDGCQLVGWLGNQIDPEFPAEGSLATLKSQLDSPYLGYLPHAQHADASAYANQLDVSCLVTD